MTYSGAMSPPSSPTTIANPDPSTPSVVNQKPSSPLALDLSNLPPLITPSPPSNTLLITNLNNPATFRQQTLLKIKELLDQPVPLNSFAPLRSLRRIIISYPTVEAAVATRQLLDGTTTTTKIGPQTLTLQASEESTEIREDRIRIYFGEPTPLVDDPENPDRHLKAPSLGKLLFISPPPSPPCGWEIREEDPPNTDTHAEDLQNALAGLTEPIMMSEEEDDVQAAAPTVSQSDIDGIEEMDNFGKAVTEGSRQADLANKRERSSSTTIVYHPKDHGSRNDLPAVTVEDMTNTNTNDHSAPKAIMAHTSRPPVELMES